MKPAFEKPTAEQVTAYAQSIGYRLDGGQFVDYYAQVGWLVGAGKKPMKDWQAAVRLWKRNAAPNAIFDPQRAKFAAAMQRRREDDQHLEDYVQQLQALRTWRGRTDCPFGDPVENEERLLEKARNIFGPDFVSKLRARVK